MRVCLSLLRVWLSRSRVWLSRSRVWLSRSRVWLSPQMVCLSLIRVCLSLGGTDMYICKCVDVSICARVFELFPSQGTRPGIHGDRCDEGQHKQSDGERGKTG